MEAAREDAVPNVEEDETGEWNDDEVDALISFYQGTIFGIV